MGLLLLATQKAHQAYGGLSCLFQFWREVGKRREEKLPNFLELPSPFSNRFRAPHSRSLLRQTPKVGVFDRTLAAGGVGHGGAGDNRRPLPALPDSGLSVILFFFFGWISAGDCGCGGGGNLCFGVELGIYFDGVCFLVGVG